ncbi:ABC transporter ATP-binding protein [Polynucleobacter paneuropaeus]|jgi:ATP-binding cassette subfamily B protein|uniref:ABC transporter ATP-binding protein n=1 Tax=Polynucleobacter paneuropaeus TaxID=2527775 RepID=UPI001BFD6A22|nr:ABC transporter ATP-binding protein [Polynucleobacter paneuropaeus]
MRQPIKILLTSLWKHISHRRRRQFGLLLILMLVTSFAEILSIGAVLPFLGVLTSPERIFDISYAQPFIHALKLSEPKQLLLPLTFIFSFAALVAGVMRLLLLWSSNRLSFATGADLSISIYRRTLYQPYAVHCSRNSSEVIDGISNKTSGVIFIINMCLTLISSTTLLMAILIGLLSINPLIAISAFLGFGLIYIAIIFLTRKKLSTNSDRIARESTQVIKSLQEGLGGIRDVLIDGSQVTYCQIYSNADLPLRRAQGSTLFITSSPRYAMEALGMILIAALAYSLAQQDQGIATAIPVLGTLALGSQRLLPVLQQAYSAWSGIRGGQSSLQDAIELLNQPLPEYATQQFTQVLPFNQHINLNKLSFRYSEQTPYVLKDINLTITKGSRIGFIGTTGSGKSTLLDIVMGLLEPTHGVLEIDGEKVTHGNYRVWQSHISHVPQTIFLSDGTIEENIAFGIPKDKIDSLRVRLAAQQAQIAESIDSWPKQYQTIVGERGIRLSGGQRQRIGIARALYKEADVIIFDEATSALDNETEQAVMQSIEELGKNLTLLIIAHRLTTLKNCTQIVELADGEIKRVGTYDYIMSKKI